MNTAKTMDSHDDRLLIHPLETRPDQAGLEPLRAHLDALKLPARGVEYILAVASSPPARLVGGHRRRNMILDVPLPRFGTVLQAESVSAEYYFLLDVSRRRDVVAIYDQPQTIHLTITNRRGVRTPVPYTADYLIVYQSRVGVCELKQDSELAELCRSRPVDWQHGETGYRYLPAGRYYEDLGFEYSVIPASAVSSVRGENLRLLTAVRQADDSRKLQTFRQQILKELQTTEAMQIGALLKRLKTTDVTAVLQLIDQEALHTDLDHQLLSSPTSVWVSTIPDLPQLMTQSDARLASIFETQGTVSTDVVSDPRHHHEIALRYILCGLADGALPNLSSRSDRTKRRYRQLLRDSGGDPRALLPKWSRCGNRTPRKSEAHYAVMHEAIRNCRSDPNLTSPANAYIMYQSAWHSRFSSENEIPFSLPTFYRHYETLENCCDDAVSKGGRRLGNALAKTIDPRQRGLLVTRAFATAHIDHWNVDLHLIVCSIGGKPITLRPWLTVMVDSFSGEVLGMWLSYRAPSREACTMVIRDCVRRHGRLPEMLIVDGGQEFDSVHFTTTLAGLRVTRANRPPEDPRFGKEAERVFGVFKEQFARGLPGFVDDLANARKVSGGFSASKRAALRLPELLESLETYVFSGYNFGPKSGSLDVRVDLRAQSDAMFPFSGSRLTWDTEFLIQTSIEAPRDTHRLSPGRGVRVYSRWYSSQGLHDYRGFKKDLSVRVDPFDDSLVYARIDDRWHVCRSSNSIVNAALPEYEIIAKTAEHQQLRGLIRHVAIEATRCAYDLKMGCLKTSADSKLQKNTSSQNLTHETPAVPRGRKRARRLEDISDLPLEGESR
jgi:putative transposase